MFENKRRWDLQLFAEGAAGDGGAGGEGASPAATGAEHSEDPAVAGREWLMSNGATEAQITDGRALAVGKQLLKERRSAAKADGNAGAQVAAAADEGEGSKQQTAWALPEGTTWEQLMAVPWVNQQMQDTVKKAKRDTKNATGAMEALGPALEMLARHHGLDLSNGLDHKALAEKILADDSLYEAKALQMGVDVETARKMVQRERETAARNQAQTQSWHEEQLQSHYLGMVSEAKALAQEYPGFDLKTELRNPNFARLTQPAVMQALGGLKGVYETIHREELAKQRETAAAELARQQAAAAIRSGASRPAEHGDGVTATPAARTSFTGDEIRDLAARAARGEKIAL